MPEEISPEIIPSSTPLPSKTKSFNNKIILVSIVIILLVLSIIGAMYFLLKTNQNTTNKPVTESKKLSTNSSRPKSSESNFSVSDSSLTKSISGKFTENDKYFNSTYLEQIGNNNTILELRCSNKLWYDTYGQDSTTGAQREKGFYETDLENRNLKITDTGLLFVLNSLEKDKVTNPPFSALYCRASTSSDIFVYSTYDNVFFSKVTEKGTLTDTLQAKSNGHPETTCYKPLQFTSDEVLYWECIGIAGEGDGQSSFFEQKSSIYKANFRNKTAIIIRTCESEETTPNPAKITCG